MEQALSPRQQQLGVTITVILIMFSCQANSTSVLWVLQSECPLAVPVVASLQP